MIKGVHAGKRQVQYPRQDTLANIIYPWKSVLQAKPNRKTDTNEQDIRPIQIKS